MTTIIGIRLNDFVYLATDSRRTDSNGAYDDFSDKIITSHKSAIIIAGWHGASSLIRQQPWTGGDDAYAVAHHLRTLMQDAGFVPSKDDGPLNFGCRALLAMPSGLYEFDLGMSVTKIPPGRIIAIGSGADYALGAWHMLKKKRKLEPSSLDRCIAAAAAFDAGTGGPVNSIRITLSSGEN